MKINEKVVLTLVAFLFPVSQMLAQYDVEDWDAIKEKLEEKYDVVESYETTDGRIICVRKDGVWEFSDVQGKLLSKMNISEVHNAIYRFAITINGKEYQVEKPIQDGRLFVSRYNRCAYMDNMGKLMTPFVYDNSGDIVYDAAESDEFVRINDIVGDFIKEYQYASNPPADELLSVVDASNVHLLIEDYAEKVVVGLVRYSLNNPDKIDKEKLETLLNSMYHNDSYSFTVIKTITTYYYRTAASDEARFTLISDLAQRYNDPEVNTLCGEMLLKGLGCGQNVQAAISYYEKAAINDSRDSYVENARQALRELWQSDSTHYDNRYGRLLSSYDDFRIIQDYVFVRRGNATGVCDSLLTELLPCRYKSFKCLMDPLYAVETFDDDVQLVKRGGEVLAADNYDDMLIVQFNQDNSFLVFAEKDNKWCMIGADGKRITPIVFDSVYMPEFSFGETYPQIMKDGEEFELYRAYKSNRAIIRQNDLYGLMDTGGNIVVPCQYVYIEPFEDGATTTTAQTADDTQITIEI